MSWNTLRQHAGELGFDVSFRTRPNENGDPIPDYSTPDGGDWLLIGNYEHAAGVWVRPRTDSARRLACREVSALMARNDHFVEPVAEYDSDYFAAGEPLRGALRNLAEERLLP